VLGPYLGETQIPPYMKEHYPKYKIHYVVQSVMRGQSDAIWLAREYLGGPTIMCYSDTLIETDFSFLAEPQTDSVAWVKSVPDPRRFGVAEVNEQGRITRLIEKPDSFENTLAVVGCYYFSEARDLVSAIEEQTRRGKSLRGEYFLADAINIMIERGLKMRTQTVETWLDTGTVESTLETNRYLLEHGCGNTKTVRSEDSRIVPPVFVHPSAEIHHSTIGPYVSIGANCIVTDSRLESSILEDGVTVETAAIKDSFIGRQARVVGHAASDPLMVLNVGDNSSISFE